jgi:hypothetical protein
MFPFFFSPQKITDYLNCRHNHNNLPDTCNQQNTKEKPFAEVGRLPALDEIITIPKPEFYGVSVCVSNPTSFHTTSPWSTITTDDDGRWATTNPEKDDQKDRNSMIYQHDQKQLARINDAQGGKTDQFSLYSSSPEQMRMQVSEDDEQQNDIETPPIPRFHSPFSDELPCTIPNSYCKCVHIFSVYGTPGIPPKEVPCRVKSPAAPIVTHVAGMTDDEDFLTSKIIQFFEDRKVNPYLGSLPSERVVNYARANFSDQYLRVVGNSPGAWEQFVSRHQDKLTIFCADRNKRIRLIKHCGYEIADDLMKSFRSEKEARIIACLGCVLPSQGCSCTLDSFLDCCTGPTLNVHMEKKPPRGDLKRLVLKNAKIFAFEKSDFKITRIAH